METKHQHIIRALEGSHTIRYLYRFNLDIDYLKAIVTEKRDGLSPYRLRRVSKFGTMSYYVITSISSNFGSRSTKAKIDGTTALAILPRMHQERRLEYVLRKRSLHTFIDSCLYASSLAPDGFPKMES